MDEGGPDTAVPSQKAGEKLHQRLPDLPGPPQDREAAPVELPGAMLMEEHPALVGDRAEPGSDGVDQQGLTGPAEEGKELLRGGAEPRGAGRAGGGHGVGPAGAGGPRG